jgi:predicted nucleic acid-binding protein
VEVECLWTLDRLRLAEGLSDEEIAVRREAVFRLVETMEIVELTRPVLTRAAQPLPTALGTLDAIHLATALLWKERTGADLVMATHDGTLATATKASGLRVARI